jgi:hypothetical protein
MIQGALLILVSLAAAPQADAAGPVAHWKFDGDVKDSGPAAVPTKTVGRMDFLDSPISGKTAVFNGVDTFVQADPAGKIGAGSGDFALSAWILPLDRRPATLFARKHWSLVMMDGGVLQLRIDKGRFSSPAGFLPAAQWNHIVLTVKRNAGGPEAALYVNGERFGAGAVPDADLDPPGEPLLLGKGDDGKLFTGMIDDVRLYSRELDPESVRKLCDEGLPWIRQKPHVKTPFPGKFELLQNDVVVFTGGENSRVGLDLGYLETLLAIRSIGASVRFRNMAWEGDTVTEQYRPVNFGPWGDQLRRVGASVVFAQFGQLESLDGKDGVEGFVAAYEALLDQYARVTRRIVLVSPTPFGKGAPPRPDLSTRNDDLKLYVDAIRRLAVRKGYLFVDLSTKALAEERLTRDGLHLTTAGQWIAARETLRQLEIPGLSDFEEPNAQGAFKRESLEGIRTAIGAKNRLWNNSWRPTNWSFLNGDRMEQPSSRDHIDRRIRWFPVEIQQFPALVRREEEKIDAMIQGAEKK